MEKTPILILSTALAGGGAEMVARLMVERMEGSACVLFQNDADVTVLGKKIRVATVGCKNSFIMMLMANVWRLVEIQWAKLKYRPEVTISHLEGPNIFNILTCFGGRKVLFVHNRVSQSYQSDAGVDRIKLGLVKVLYHRADKIVGVSEDVCEELITSYGVDREKVQFLRNPINKLAILKDSKRSYGDFRDNILEDEYLVNVASLTTQKNQEFLLRVFRKLLNESERHNNLRLIILGDGDRRDALHILCKKLELSVFDPKRSLLGERSQVWFLGFEKNPYPLIRRARIFMNTSRWEGLPISLLEAMSLGVPGVVANCSDGIRSVWQAPTDQKNLVNMPACRWTDYGALMSDMENGDESVRIWTKAIRRLLEDNTLRKKCGDASQIRSEDYDLSKVVDIWEKELLTLN
jgi:glycosyltransferase involved in cell wall biosynthesis